MRKVIAAGHICLDITPVFPQGHVCASLEELLVPGKLIRTEGVSVHTGGSVANTGLALKLLGNDVILMGKVGRDAFGDMVRGILAGYGAGGLIVDGKDSTSYSVVLAPPGFDRIFLHSPGANDTFSSEDVPEEDLEDAVLFHFGYPPLMKRMVEAEGAELEGMFRRVKAKGIVTSLDLAAVDPRSPAGNADWEAILRRVLKHVDFFEPSFEELCFMLDRPEWERLASAGTDMTQAPEVTEKADTLARRCLEMGCGVVLVKCGLSGMVYRTGSAQRLGRTGSRMGLDVKVWAQKAGHQPCFRAEYVRSGTGAGDVSIAAFLTALLQGEAPEECVRLAAAEGAASVTSYDALGGILPLEELRRRIRAGWKTYGRAEGTPVFQNIPADVKKF